MFMIFLSQTPIATNYATIKPPQTAATVHAHINASLRQLYSAPLDHGLFVAYAPTQRR